MGHQWQRKITDKRLKWYEHVKRREEGPLVTMMSDAPTPDRNVEVDRRPIDGSTARRCIAIVTNERRASYVIPLNSS